jgi:hypothetical protein
MHIKCWTEFWYLIRDLSYIEISLSINNICENVGVIIFLFARINMWALPSRMSPTFRSVKFLNLFPRIQLSLLKYYNRSPIYPPFLSTRWLGGTGFVWCPVWSLSFERKYEIRAYFLSVLSILFSGTLCICVLRSQTIFSFVNFPFIHQCLLHNVILLAHFYHNLVSYTHWPLNLLYVSLAS